MSTGITSSDPTVKATQTQEMPLTAGTRLGSHEIGGWRTTDQQAGRRSSWGSAPLAFSTDFVDTPGTSYAVSLDGARLLVVKSAIPAVTLAHRARYQLDR